MRSRDSNYSRSVVSVIPAQGATNVIINTTITATFSMAMNPASITADNLHGDGAGRRCRSWSRNVQRLTTATFTPTAVLAYGTTYTATITAGASTPGGTSLR
jgi:hypothetical protein